MGEWVSESVVNISFLRFADGKTFFDYTRQLDL